MMGSEFADVLLSIVLLLAAIALLGAVILTALAIKVVLEAFALARAARTQVATIGDVVKAVGERFTGGGSVLGLLDLFRKRPARRKAK